MGGKTILFLISNFPIFTGVNSFVDVIISVLLNIVLFFARLRLSHEQSRRPFEFTFIAALDEYWMGLGHPLQFSPFWQTWLHILAYP